MYSDVFQYFLFIHIIILRPIFPILFKNETHVKAKVGAATFG